jgi:hypothetical protein
MSKSGVGPSSIGKQKICTLWTHDDNFSRDDVVFNADRFSELDVHPGSLVRVIALKQATATRDFQSTGKRDVNNAKVGDGYKKSHAGSHSRKGRRHPATLTLDENGVVIPGGRELDEGKSYVFVSRPMTPDLKSKHPNLQVRRTLHS